MSRELSSKFKSAFVGSIAAFFFGWVPFIGPVFGGVLAGYLRGPDSREGVKTGILASIIASVPLLLLAGLVGLAQVTEGVPEGLIGLLMIVTVSCVYFYGCGAVEGYVGSAFSNRDSPNRL